MADITQVREQVAQDEEVIDIPIVQKNGEPFLAKDGTTPATIGVVGSESKRYIAERDRQTKQLIRQNRRRGGNTETTPDELRANRVAMAAAAVVRWNGWESNGEPWPCEPENVKALLGSSADILEQVEDGIERHARFFALRSAS